MATPRPGEEVDVRLRIIPFYELRYLTGRSDQNLQGYGHTTCKRPVVQERDRSQQNDASYPQIQGHSAGFQGQARRELARINSKE